MADQPDYGFTSTDGPPAGPTSVQVSEGNGMAVAGLVLGIIGVVLLWVPILNWVLSLLGIIFGALGLGKAKRIGGKGKGLAMSGLILGLFAAVAGTAFVVWAWQQAKHGHFRRF